MNESSPAVHCWVRLVGNKESVERTTEIFSRPFHGLFALVDLDPTDESVGYFHKSAGADLLVERVFLLPLPADAVLGVFQNNAAVSEFHSNLIGATEVPTPPSFLSLIDQTLNFAVEHFS